MVSRRTFLKGLAAASAALVLPPTLTDNAEAARRFWALDSTMVSPEPEWGMFSPYNTAASFAEWVEAYETRDHPLIDTLHLADTSCIRQGDVLRITVPGVWDTPDEYVVVESVRGHDLVSVWRV